MDSYENESIRLFILNLNNNKSKITIISKEDNSVYTGFYSYEFIKNNDFSNNTFIKEDNKLLIYDSSKTIPLLSLTKYTKDSIGIFSMDQIKIEKLIKYAPDKVTHIPQVSYDEKIFFSLIYQTNTIALIDSTDMSLVKEVAILNSNIKIINGFLLLNLSDYFLCFSEYYIFFWNKYNLKYAFELETNDFTKKFNTVTEYTANLLLCGHSKSVSILDINLKKILKLIDNIDSHIIHKIIVLPRNFFTYIGDDYAIKIWKKTNQVERKISLIFERTTFWQPIQIFPISSTLVCISFYDSSIMVLDLVSLNIIRHIKQFGMFTNILSISGSLFIGLTYDNYIKLFSANKEKLKILKTFKLEDSIIAEKHMIKLNKREILLKIKSNLDNDYIIKI